MTAYYNEIDPYAAQWLKNLIAAKLIASGDVDERSIVDVRASDLAGYTQCHFFAGIGGWSYALRLAGWPDDRPAWTGSCPCQPFSAAGAGKAGDDERHLWPAWLPLIAECRPAIVFGEQVEAAIGWGWLDAVFADLESEGYACGASVLPACSVGAPQNGPRLYFMAETNGSRRNWCAQSNQRATRRIAAPRWDHADGRCRAPWAAAIKMEGADNSRRLLEPGVGVLVDGLSKVSGRLRAYGNAIVPQVAAEFIAAYQECSTMTPTRLMEGEKNDA